jgi:hypothetical protein
VRPLALLSEADGVAGGPVIVFLTSAGGRANVFRYLAGPGAADEGHVLTMTYERLLAGRQPKLVPGVYVFTLLGRLSPRGIARARALYEDLRADPRRYVVLNEPGRTLGRLQLLRELHSRGVNGYRVWAADEPIPADVRFPVFLRQDDMPPDGSLIPDTAALDLELDRLLRQPAGGQGWLCCEFAGRADRDGTYRKYSAMMVGDEVIPRHLFFSDRWVVKYADLVTRGDLLEEEQRYLRDNPHEAAIREIFGVARCDYGRIDYDVRDDGALRVWEINTHPVLLPRLDPSSPRAELNIERSRAVIAALRRLDPSHPAEREPVEAKVQRVRLAAMRRYGHGDPSHTPSRPMRLAARIERRIAASSGRVRRSLLR